MNQKSGYESRDRENKQKQKDCSTCSAILALDQRDNGYT